jgi:hypothetical protein
VQITQATPEESTIEFSKKTGSGTKLILNKKSK